MTQNSSHTKVYRQSDRVIAKARAPSAHLDGLARHDAVVGGGLHRHVRLLARQQLLHLGAQHAAHTLCLGPVHHLARERHKAVTTGCTQHVPWQPQVETDPCVALLRACPLLRHGLYRASQVTSSQGAACCATAPVRQHWYRTSRSSQRRIENDAAMSSNTAVTVRSRHYAATCSDSCGMRTPALSGQGRTRASASTGSPLSSRSSRTRSAFLQQRGALLLSCPPA